MLQILLVGARYIPDPSCSCGAAKQTVSHIVIVNDCPQSRFPGVLTLLYISLVMRQSSGWACSTNDKKKLPDSEKGREPKLQPQYSNGAKVLLPVLQPLDLESDALTITSQSHTVIILANLNVFFLFMDNMNISTFTFSRFCVSCRLLYACTYAECADHILSCKMLRQKSSLKSMVHVVNAKISAGSVHTANLRFFLNLFCTFTEFCNCPRTDCLYTDACIH